ncbi:hypothetical protein V6N11_080124 [Hibiscus sabdariffa]|uniref:Uncharacterized protein n=2 Tax=Hibiscus sabdariffa TaxID=183260 RepID=A0ABR2CKX3_9ROSI
MQNTSKDPRFLKKQRGRDDNSLDDLNPSVDPPPTAMDCDNTYPLASNDNPTKPTASYKDMEIGSSNVSSKKDLISLDDDDDDDDISLLEEDIRISESYCIPFIDFSEHIPNLVLKSMVFTLVVKVIGKHMSYNVV